MKGEAGNRGKGGGSWGKLPLALGRASARPGGLRPPKSRPPCPGSPPRSYSAIKRVEIKNGPGLKRSLRPGRLPISRSAAFSRAGARLWAEPAVRPRRPYGRKRRAAAYREPLMARKARHKLKFILLDEFIVNLIKIYS